MINSLLISVFLIIQSIFHPFFISLTEIKYNPAKASLEISQKIFWDDLEVELSDLYKSKIDLLKPIDKPELERKLRQYILQHNEISINGKKVELTFLGYEIEDEAAWFYLEAKKIPKPATASVRNSVLCKNFDSQQNIINFYRDKNPKSLILEKGKDQGLIRF